MGFPFVVEPTVVRADVSYSGDLIWENVMLKCTEKNACVFSQKNTTTF